MVDIQANILNNWMGHFLQYYRVYCDQLHHYRQQCQQVLDEVSSALNHLSDLQQQYVHVSTKTNALHEACEESMNDQV